MNERAKTQPELPYFEPIIGLFVNCIVLVTQFFRCDTLLEGLGFGGGSILVRPAYVERTNVPCSYESKATGEFDARKSRIRRRSHYNICRNNFRSRCAYNFELNTSKIRLR